MEYDPKTDLRHWPAPNMGRFGANPYGENLYRIVFAPSRRHLVYGTWADGSRKASWIKSYPTVGDTWVLEKWLSAFEFAGCAREEWDQNLSVLGAYPERGEYEICHIFEACGPADANLEKLISWIEEGKKRNPNENATALRNAAERDQAELSATMQDMIGNKIPAFGSAPMSGFGGGRGTKTAPIFKSANELGLPTMKPAKEKGKSIARSSLIAGNRFLGTQENPNGR